MTKTDWKDLPNTTTPITASRLNAIEDGLVNVGVEIDEDYNTNFVLTKNLFNYTNTSQKLTGVNINVDTSTLVSDNTCAVAYLKCKPNTTYTISRRSPMTNRFVIATTSDKPIVGTSLLTKQAFFDDTTTDYTLTTGSTANYIVIRFINNISSNDYDTYAQTIQVEYGEEATPYSPFIQNKIVVDNETFTDTIKVGTEVDDKSRVNLLLTTNLFDKNSITKDYYIAENGTTASNSSVGYSNYIAVKPGANYKISGKANGWANTALYDKNKVFISRTTDTPYITTPANCYYIRTNLKLLDLDTIMIVEGTEAPSTYTPMTPSTINIDNEKYTDTLNISSEVDNTKGLNVLYSPNLFDKKIGDIQNGLWYDASNNKITSNNGGWYVVIPIESNKSYTISRKNINNNNGLHLAVGTTASTPTANASFVSFGDDYGANVKLVHINSGATAKYMIIYVMGVAQNLMTDTLKTLSLEEMQVEVGTIQTTYTPFITPSIVVNNETIYTQAISNYSTEEQVIGKWIDGKPLYRKVVDFGALPNATSKSVAHNITNISYITNIKGTALQSNATNFILLPTNYINSINVGNINVQISTNNDLSAFDKCYLTIEYTKTTD